MNAFIFVAVVCIGQQCNFVTGKTAVPYKQCEEMKKEFLASPFKKEVTLAASQCMEFKGENVKDKVWL